MPQGYSSPEDSVNVIRGKPGRTWKGFKAMGVGPSAARNYATDSPEPTRSVDGPLFPSAVISEVGYPAGDSTYKGKEVIAPPDAWPQL